MPSKKRRAAAKKPSPGDLVKCCQCGHKCIRDNMMVCLTSDENFCSDPCHTVWHEKGGRSTHTLDLLTRGTDAS